jgi:hypothetical protein
MAAQQAIEIALKALVQMAQANGVAPPAEVVTFATGGAPGLPQVIPRPGPLGPPPPVAPLGSATQQSTSGFGGLTSAASTAPLQPAVQPSSGLTGAASAAPRTQSLSDRLSAAGGKPLASLFAASGAPRVRSVSVESSESNGFSSNSNSTENGQTGGRRTRRRRRHSQKKQNKAAIQI